jgi:hypothetical protein
VHEELAALIRKSEDQPESLSSVLELRQLQGLFAESCSVSGDAEAFVKQYAPQELVSTIAAVRAALNTIELGFGEITVEFPEADLAVSRFAAVLTVTDNTGEELTELRDVESRMREIDGEWLFSAFEFSRSETPPVLD